MIKLKDLIIERIVTPDEFMREMKRAEKETGKKFKVPSSTKAFFLGEEPPHAAACPLPPLPS